MSLVPLPLLQQLNEFDTALVANTISAIDSTPAHEWYMASSIESVTPSLGPTVGIAYTCELDSSTPGGQASMDDYWRILEEMEQSELPSVLVVQTVGSRPDHECVLGDGMAKCLYSVGCIGIVTNGGVRDTAGLLTVPFAAYAKGRTIHHGCLRFRRPNTAVEIGGITVRHGDIIHADSGGVITIPRTALPNLPERAVMMQALERDAHSLLRRTDKTLSEKRSGVQAMLARYGFRSAVDAELPISPGNPR